MSEEKDMGKYRITIILGEFTTTVKRNMFKDVALTADGIVFNFTNGLYLTLLAPYMPNIMKERIKASIDNFKYSNIEVDLENGQFPVRVMQ